MDEALSTSLPQRKKPSWTKRHQVAIAIVGAVLSTASYFGKDYAQEHWKGLASGIQAAEEKDEEVQNTTSLNQRIDLLMDDVDVLTKDALAVEQHRKPTAQSDRLDSTQGASLSSRNHQVVAILRKCQMRLKSLSAIDAAQGSQGPYRDELKQIRADVDGKVATSLKLAITFLGGEVTIFGPEIVADPTRQDRQNAQMDELEKQTDAIEHRTDELGTAIREDADQRRELYTRYKEWTTLALSSIFVIGLLLSLMGKLTGEDAEVTGGE